MRITPLIVYFGIILFACNSPKQLTTKIQKETIELIVPQEVKKGTSISFEIKNNTSEGLIIHRPEIKNIQKLENGSWRKIRILYCPCGANCIPPPKTKLLKPNEKLEYTWNLLESWCDKKVKNKIPKTIEQKSPVGLYRISITYSPDGTNKMKKIKEFSITD